MNKFEKLTNFSLRDICYVIDEAELKGYISKEEAKKEYLEILRLIKNILISESNNDG